MADMVAVIPEHVLGVLARLDEGNDLDAIAAMPGMPSRATLYRMARERDDVRQALARAREMMADGLVREAGACSDEPLPADPRMASAAVQRNAQRSGFRRWLAERFARDTYGERPLVEINIGQVALAFSRLSSPVASEDE